MVGLPFRTSRSQPQGVPLPQLTEKSISGVLQDLEVPENSKTQGDNDLPGSLSHGKNDDNSKVSPVPLQVSNHWDETLTEMKRRPTFFLACIGTS